MALRLHQEVYAGHLPAGLPDRRRLPLRVRRPVLYDEVPAGGLQAQRRLLRDEFGLEAVLREEASGCLERDDVHLPDPLEPERRPPRALLRNGAAGGAAPVLYGLRRRCAGRRGRLFGEGRYGPSRGPGPGRSGRQGKDPDGFRRWWKTGLVRAPSAGLLVRSCTGHALDAETGCPDPLL